MKRMIRWAVIDLDGTLLGPDHRIAPAQAQAVRDCLAAGVRVSLASGRTYASMSRYCLELGLEGPQITLNGGAIVASPSGTAEAGACLAEADLLHLADGLTRLGVPFVAFSAHGLFALPGDRASAVLEQYGEPPAIELPSFRRKHLPDPIKLLAFAPDDSRDAELIALANGVTDTVRTGGGFFEYMVPGVTKGTALKTLMAREGVDPATVLAVGDYYNDLSLFAAVGTSVAMGNAPAEVQAAADFVTAAATDDGLARALNRFILDQPAWVEVA